jgi:hypothetical protein
VVDEFLLVAQMFMRSTIAIILMAAGNSLQLLA